MRICSLLPSATEILYSLGLEDQVVGVTHECDFPPSASLRPHVTESLMDSSTLTSADIDRHVAGSVGNHGSIYRLKEDVLAALKPDLIVTQELCEVCTVSYSEVQKAVKVLDGPVRVVSLEPETLDEVLSTIPLLADLTGVPEAGHRLLASLRARLESVRSATAALSRRRVACLEWLDPFFSAGHWVPAMVEIAGGTEVAGSPGAKSRRMSPEDLSRAAPDVLILIPCGFDLARTVAEYRNTRRFDGWMDLPAVRNREIYALDGSAYFSRSGPRLVDGVETLAEILHPEVCAGAAPRGSYMRIDE